MDIKIHRGLKQIGGCITEISTETSRVFIDFGQNLPGNGKPANPTEDKELVTRIFAQNKKLHEAVFYSHGHEDHVGLFEYIPNDVPQYMSKGTNELLQIKYDVLCTGAELMMSDTQNKECDSQDNSIATILLDAADKKCKLLKKMVFLRRS